MHLAKQIKEHSFYRAYHAVVYGNIKEDKGTVNEPIGRNPKDRKKMAVVYNNSRNAITHYEVIERFGSFTHIKCILETGRTHQIRVHMAYLGHALAGDSVYGPKKVITKLSGQCLHAGEIGFIHPRTNEYLHFTSPCLPARAKLHSRYIIFANLKLVIAIKAVLQICLNILCQARQRKL